MTNTIIDKAADKLKKIKGYKAWIVGNRCHRCGHEWRPRNFKERPAVCPKCKSPYWHKEKTLHKK